MHLAIQLLGTPQFQLDEVPVTANRRAVVALLAYLAVTDFEHPGQRFSRDSLAELLWSDYDPAKGLANLRHTLWEVTKFVGEDWVIAEYEVIYLNPKENFILDVAKFRALLRQVTQQSNPAFRIPLLRDATELYRGDFMSGFTLKEGSVFNEWVLSRATVLRRECASALEMLVEEYSILNQPQSAIPYAQRLIELDPIDEATHCKLMELYARTDQRAAAIQQYQALEKLLRKELNLDPQPETREVYKRIRRGEFRPIPVETNAPPQQKTRHNLPVRLTTFIGREKEREEIRKLLAENRLVTLIGAGGIGKTRLSIEIGHSLLNGFSAGIWFIPLESLTDQELLPQTVASFLNIAEQADHPMLETLIDQLRNKNSLLILDNCEHLLDACAQLVENLLQHCPTLKILTTSREALRLEGEAFYYVPALAVPPHHEVRSIDEFAQYESIRLFLQRAKLVIPGFALTQANVETVVKICDRLDGIPLAIELAAARIDIFALEEVLGQLNRSFDLLISHTRLALPRHQTMRTCIDWGWNLLTEAERTFMSRLSVFLGGWTLHAAQAIGLSEAQQLTGSLVKKSFVIVHKQTRHETRYGFHEVIRAFAQEQLALAGEDSAMRDHHLEYFLELARQFEPALHGIDQDSWLERLSTERDNLRAALEWAARTNVQAGLYLSNRLRTFWENYDLREEARWLLLI